MTGPDRPVRIIITKEAAGWGAGSPDLADFVLLRSSLEKLKADLPAALEAHCGRPVEYKLPRRTPTRAKAAETVALSVEINDCSLHYSFSESWPPDRPGPPLSESLTVTLQGTIVSPKEKAGRDLHATISDSERFAQPMRPAPQGAPRPVIGELFWGADRVARVYVPPTTVWPLAHAICAGHVKRLGLTADAPLRGNVPIRGLRLVTREIGEGEDHAED